MTTTDDDSLLLFEFSRVQLCQLMQMMMVRIKVRPFGKLQSQTTVTTHQCANNKTRSTGISQVRQVC